MRSAPVREVSMRKPQIAGTWYPDDAGKLEQIFSPWAETPPRDMCPSALILPHAGYAYSGDIAAEACSHADPSAYRRIIILAPSHRMAFPGKVSVEPAGDVETPFGPAGFSGELHDRLLALPCATHIPEAHPAEHSIAIQLPLLKRFFPQCAFGALLVGDLIHAGEAVKKSRATLARALHDLLDAETLLVVSSDFTHYGKSFGYVPFTEQIPRNMEDLDSRAWEAFAANRPDIFADFMRHTRATVCGASSMLLLLEALPEQARFTRIDYANSGMKTGDYSHCVGYTAGAVETDWSLPCKKTAAGSGSDPISLRTGRLLPMLARRQLRRHFGLPCNALLPPMDPGMFIELQRLRATFVTLSIRGRLRGCIGDILPLRPLWDSVTARAGSAAFEDPRFPKLTREELDKVDIEVSVLTPPLPIASPSEIVIGRHGVILQKSRRSAVFLPQVAPEQGWDVPTMLTHLSLKAGLPSDAWKEGCQFFAFTAQIFREMDSNAS